MTLKHFFKIYYKTVIWLCLMFYMLFSPESGLPKVKLLAIPYFDKFVHLGMFSLFVFLFLIDSEYQVRKIRMYIFFIIPCLLFSAFSEIIQYFYISGRSGNIYDFIADFFGIAAGNLFYFLVWKKIRNKLNYSH
jgi:VanZ family protein